MAGTRRIHRAALASLAIIGILGAACGRAGSPGVGAPVVRQRVIQDPDNPASRNFVGQQATTLTIGASGTISATGVLRDPDNPYWAGR